MNCRRQFFAVALLITICNPVANGQSRTISAPAHVAPYERADIFAKASGFVAAVHVDIGDMVKKGQLLAELSIPEMEHEHLKKQALLEQSAAAILQAEARVTTAKSKILAATASVAASQSEVAAAKAQLEKYNANIAFAQSELSRVTMLVSSRSVNAAMKDEKEQQLRAAKAALSGAEAEVQTAQSRVEAVEASIQVAKADLNQAEADLYFARSQRKVAEASLAHTVALMEYARITAPFDGSISHRGIDTGDFVISAASSRTMGASLFTLNRVDRYRIVFDVPEASASRTLIGQSVELTVDSCKDQTFTGQIKRTSGVLDQRTRTLRVEAEVTDDDSQLRSGMYGTIVVTAENPVASEHIGRRAANEK